MPKSKYSGNAEEQVQRSDDCGRSAAARCGEKRLMWLEKSE